LAMEEESTSSDNPQSRASSLFPDDAGSVSSGDEAKANFSNENEISENHEDGRQEEEENDHDETSTEVDDGDDTTEEPEPKRARRTSSSGGCPVLRIDKETGKVLEEYTSPSEAALQTGISSGGIGHVLQGRQKTAGGFVFRYKYDEDRVRNKKNKATAGIPCPVLRIDKETGNVLEEYPSISEAAQRTDISRTKITYILQGRNQTAGGFVFRYKYDEDKLRNKNKRNSDEGTPTPVLSTPVLRLDTVTGKVLEEYPSITEAADAIGVDQNQLGNVLKQGSAKEVKGFLFQYKSVKKSPSQATEKPRSKGQKSRRAGRRIPILKIDRNTGEVLQEYQSAKEAANDIGVDSSLISNVLCGRQQTAGGFVVRYKNDQDRIRRDRKTKTRYKAAVVAVLKLDIITGKILEEYPSASEAANSIGVRTESLCDILKEGTAKEVKGFLFRYKSEDNLPKTKQSKKPVLLVHAETGETIEEYASIKEAAAATGVSSSNISQICSGNFKRTKTGDGQCFRYKFEHDRPKKRSKQDSDKTEKKAQKLRKKESKKGKKQGAEPKQALSGADAPTMKTPKTKTLPSGLKKPVLRFDPKTGEILQEYGSVQEAADAIGVKHNRISKVVTGRSRTAKGHHFRYKFELDRPPTVPLKKKPISESTAPREKSISIAPRTRTVVEQPTFKSNLLRPNTILRVHVRSGKTDEEYSTLDYAATANGLTADELSQVISKGETINGCFRFRYKYTLSALNDERLSSFADDSNTSLLQPLTIAGLPPVRLEQRRDANGLLVPLQLDDLLKDFLPEVKFTQHPPRCGGDDFMKRLQAVLARQREAVWSNINQGRKRKLVALTPEDLKF
jgi:hypothetical protein